MSQSRVEMEYEAEQSARWIGWDHGQSLPLQSMLLLSIFCTQIRGSVPWADLAGSGRCQPRHHPGPACPRGRSTACVMSWACAHSSPSQKEPGLNFECRWMTSCSTLDRAHCLPVIVNIQCRCRVTPWWILTDQNSICVSHCDGESQLISPARCEGGGAWLCWFSSAGTCKRSRSSRRAVSLPQSFHRQERRAQCGARFGVMRGCTARGRSG